MAGAYWPRPWTCEDGGPRRWCCADGEPGLGIRPGRAARGHRRRRRLRDRRAGAARARGAVRAAPRHPAPPAAGDARSRAGSSGSTPRRSRSPRPRRGCPAARTGPAGSPRTRTATCTWSSAAGRIASAPDLEVLASHRLPVAAPAQLVRRARRRRARHQGLRRAGRARALDRLGARPRDAAAGGAAAAAPRAVDRAARVATARA